MEGWEHMITVREVTREDESPVGRHSTRARETRKKTVDQRQVCSDQPPHIEGQSRSKDDILQR